METNLYGKPVSHWWRRISRRSWLLSWPALSLLRAQEEPRNVVFPLRDIPGTITPEELFFVRDHFPEPELSLTSWRLKIEGRVARPFDASFSDLLEAPARKLEAVLDCAGNAASGSAVANGVWEGVPIADLLAEAKPERGAAMVLLEGADVGSLYLSPKLPYCRLVPLARCQAPESLVAFKLNDRFLSRSRGFPARAFLPAWYGMDAVKWLQRILVLGPGDKPAGFRELGMDRFYNRVLKGRDGARATTPLSELQVKSVIAYPEEHERLAAGVHTVWGFAWTGNSVIRSVEVSADGGRSWEPAKFQSPLNPLVWVRWAYRWRASPGEYMLMSRASDAAGNRQPLHRDPARLDPYELNWCAPVPCSVK